MPTAKMALGMKNKKVNNAPESGLFGDGRLALADMLLLEQELTVQVRHVDRVQVDDLNVFEA